MKFREVLQKALDEGIVSLPNNVEISYTPVENVYRMVKLNKEKKTVTEEDFMAQAEKPSISLRSDFDKYDIGNYGCSFFVDEETMKVVLRLPLKNRGIAKGTIFDSYGQLLREDNSAHVMCFIYEGAELSDSFEVIE